MRNTMPLRWIEQAEARQVLAAARFEQLSPPAPWRKAAGAAVASWLPRVRCWLVPVPPAGWPLLQPQPALVRRSACPRAHRRGADAGYSCDW